MSDITESMKRRLRDLYFALDLVCDAYNEAIKNDYIQKPIAYALYQTWKYFDEHERSRKRGHSENN